MSDKGILRPYLPLLAIEWLSEASDRTAMSIEGTVAFVDISGFTKLSERLAKRGKVGAEELTDTIGSCFRELLAIAYANGGGLIKFGGDALLLLFRGENHQTRACCAAVGMRAKLRTVGNLTTPGGRVRLKMSVGVHSGSFDFFLVGSEHRELIVTGPAATETTAMEQAADAGEIVVSASTATALPKRLVGEPKGPGVLLRGAPPGDERPPTLQEVGDDIDLGVAVPTVIREHLLGGGSEPEHRQATVAFLRFEGSDEVIPHYGTSVMADRLHDLVSIAQEAAARHHVTFLGTDIDKNGGKIILVAGAPVATEADEEAALLTVREILDRRPPLPARIGVNRGHVFAGDIGPEYRRTYTVMGDTVNLAARLMAAAKPRQIYATGPVLERSRTRFETEALEPFMVKGKAKPVEAFSLGQPLASPPRAPREHVALVGRKAELGALTEALASAAIGAGRTVELVGDAGVGKSRLIEEIRERGEAFTIYVAAGGPYAAATPYFPFRSLVREILEITDVDPIAAVDIVRTRIDALAPDLVPWLPLLGIVADLPIPPTLETRRLSEEFRRTQLERTVVDLVATLLKDPTMLVFEDAHYFDEGSRGLLGALTRGVAERPWLIVVGRRPLPEDQPVANIPHHTSLGIGALDPHEAAELSELLLGDEALSESALTTVVERSGGNPLFLIELLETARHAGSIDDLPDSVEALMMARIDLLPPTDRIVLRSASVLGTTFEPDLLAAVLGGDASLDDAGLLMRLNDYLRPSERGRLRFVSGLIRDAAYEGLTYRRRRALHARAADTIVARSARPEDVAELVALHYFHAQRHEETWHYARIAGTRAQSKYANADAARFFGQAVEAAWRLPSPDHPRIVETYEMIGDAWKSAGEFRLSEKAYRAARRVMSGDDLTDARLVFKEALIAHRLGALPVALKRLTRVRKMLKNAAADEARRQSAEAAAWYAEILAIRGSARDAIRWARLAIAEAESSGQREALARACVMLDYALEALGRAGAYENMHRALEIYEQLEDIDGQTVALGNLGQAAYFAGRWSDALDLYERARLGREKLGDPVGAAFGTFNVAEVLSDQGRLEEAEPLLKRVLRIWRAAGDSVGAAYALSQLGRVAARGGRFEEALSLYEQAREGFTHAGHVTDVVETEARIAECLVLRGDAREALHVLKDAISRDEGRGGVTAQAPLLYRSRGYALMQLGDNDAARHAFETSLAAASKRQAEHEVALTLRAIGQLARQTGAPDRDAEARSEEILRRLEITVCADPPPVFRRRVGVTIDMDEASQPTPV